MADSQPVDGGLTIHELWEAAEEDFMRTTGVSLRSKSKTSLEDVMSRFDTKYGTGKSDKHGKTRKIVFNIITVIQNVGGLAIQGVSMVFGPAQLCFSAVSFLLDIPAKIDAVFGSVGAVFESLEHYLVKLEIYKRIEKTTKLPQELLHSTNLVLTSFVNVCAVAYGLAFGSKTAKLKAATLAALCNDDSGVSGALKQFSDLIDKQLALESSLNLEHTLIIEENTQHIPEIVSGVTEIRKAMGEGMETLVSAERNRSTDKFAVEQRAALIKALDIQKEVLEEQDKLLDAMRSDSLQEGNPELTGDDLYSKWADVTSDSQMALFLSGEPHSGKSYLVYEIIEDMKSRAISDDGNVIGGKVIVAHHFFQKQDDRTMKVSKRQKSRAERPVEIALKHLCFQIAQQHKGYAKEILALLKNVKPRGRTIEEVWTDLMIGQPKGDTVHVLIFDGLDQLEAADAETLFRIVETQQKSSHGQWSAFPSRSKVRMLISSTPKTFPSASLQDVPKLDAVAMNASNIKFFIRQELSSSKLWEEDTAITRSLIEFILETLPTASNGDFAVVMQALDSVKLAVEDGRGLDKAKQALVDACEQDPKTIAPRTLDDLSKSLSVQDIKRLNNLLKWVMWGRARFTLQELRAISFLESRDDPIQSFETIMRTKYARIFSIGSDDSVDVREEIDAFLRDKPGVRGRPIKGPGTDGSKISMEIKISNASVSQVRRFLWNLNERANLEPFLFESLDDQIEDKAIQAYSLDSWVHIATRLLELLNDDLNEITETVFPHAMLVINDYLTVLYDRATSELLEPEELKMILSGIIAFLTDVDILEQHGLSPVHIRDSWLLDEEEKSEHILYSWLTYEAAISQLDRRDRRRLKSLMDPPGYLSFYRPFTQLMAKRWLLESKYPPGDAYNWIDDFLESELVWKNRQERNSSSADEIAGVARTNTNESQVSEPSLTPELTQYERVVRALMWAKENLPHWEENDLWFLRLGETYWVLALDEEAIEAFEAGKELSSNNWELFANCASAYAGKDDLDRAVQEMLQGLQMVREKPEVDLKAEKGYLYNVSRLVGWYIELGLYNKAIEECRGGLLIDPSEWYLHSQMLEATRRSGAISETETHLTVTLANPVEGEVDSKLTQMVKFAVENFLRSQKLTILNEIFTSARQIGALNILRQSLRQLSESREADKRFSYFTTCRLFECHLLVFTDLASEAGNTEKAIEMLEHLRNRAETIDQFDLSSEVMSRLFHGMRQTLATCYSDRLIASDTTDDEERKNLLEPLQEMVRLQRSRGNNWPEALSFLVSYFIRMDQKEQAQELLRHLLEDYLDMLVDDTTVNDPEAFFSLALILGCFRDDYNSLMAWSLLPPFDAEVGLDPEHCVTEEEFAKIQGIHPGDESEQMIKSLNPTELELDHAVERYGGEINGVTSTTSADDDDEKDANDEEGTLQSDKHPTKESIEEESEPSFHDPAADPKLVEAEQATRATDQVATDEKTDIKTDNVESQVNGDGASQHGEQSDGSESEAESGSESGDGRPIWFRSKREFMSPTTVNAEGLKWVFDPKDDDYIIITEPISRERIQMMFAHTRQLQRETFYLDLHCVGGCKKKWKYASDMYVCRHCQTTFFCSDCIKKIQAGDTPPFSFCTPKHEWLYVPRWSKEKFREVGKGNVRVDGELGEDGHITGGRIVPFQEWLNNIRKAWGLGVLEAEYRWVQKAQQSRIN